MNLEVGAGNSFIILGISTFLANLVVCGLLYCTENPISFFAWLLIPVISLLWIKLASNREERVVTKIDKMVSGLWISISFITVMLPLVFFCLTLQSEQELILSGKGLMAIVPFAEILIVSLGLIVNAIIIDFKPLRIGGFVGAVLSLFMLFDSMFIHAVMFGVWAISSMIVPGIKLNGYIRSKKNV